MSIEQLSSLSRKVQYLINPRAISVCQALASMLVVCFEPDTPFCQPKTYIITWVCRRGILVVH